jgi:asparagine synthetase B (glutamine-hydrolysing)
MAETYPYGGCGIAGGIATQKGTLPNINVMLEHLRHRGPDANGTWQEEGVCSSRTFQRYQERLRTLFM